jgi:hypothetical protein
LNLDPHPGVYDRNVDTESLVQEYCAGNGVESGHAVDALDALFRASTVEDLYDARESLQALHNEVLGITPPEPPAPPTIAEIAQAKAQAAAARLGAELGDAGPDYVNQD